MPVPIPGRDTLNKAATWKRNETPMPYAKGMIPLIAPPVKPQGIPPTIRDKPNGGATTNIIDEEGKSSNQKQMEGLPIGSDTTPLSGGQATDEEKPPDNGTESNLNVNEERAEEIRIPDISTTAETQTGTNIGTRQSEREKTDDSLRQPKPALQQIVSGKNEIPTPIDRTFNRNLGPPPPDLVRPIPAPPAATPIRPYGKLILKCIQGIDLKAGQGVFGKADPYLKLTIGSQVKVTDPDSQGGKKPVSLP
jgi:hypothetical protein